MKVMVSFHVQILTKFTYHVGYQPIFTRHESHLLIKEAKNGNTVIVDPTIKEVRRLMGGENWQFKPGVRVNDIVGSK